METSKINELIKESFFDTSGNVNSTEDILAWINNLNNETLVKIEECSIYNSDFWFYDDYRGEILNRKRSFFSVIGMRWFENNKFIQEQPIIIQPEIGYLGIICKVIDGKLNFLMQGKIEPGNVNCVQISPTIQATKSNFLRAHGGRLPRYFKYFENKGNYKILYDQIQSEQASRFYKKRNRNIIILIEEEIELFPEFKWMTLGQIKELLKIDNMVNMDTRTVLSGLPLCSGYESLATEAFFKLNDYKMFNEVKTTMVPLNQLVEWNVDEYGATCKKCFDFCVRFYDISISGREVQHWTQPLFKSEGSATFGLITRKVKDDYLFLIQVKSEIGAVDKAEFGPSVQWEYTHCDKDNSNVDVVFKELLMDKKNILVDVMLSEEGGRFYHEQNRNVLVMLPDKMQLSIDDKYVWVDYKSLKVLIQLSNCLNIQLRNLVSLIDKGDNYV